MVASSIIRLGKRPFTVFLFLLFALFLFIPSQNIIASPIFIVVDSFDDELADDGACTLREAIIAANDNVATGGCTAGSDSATDFIQLSAGLYNLSIPFEEGVNQEEGDLNVYEDVHIFGVSPDQTFINADGLSDRVLTVHGGVVTVENLTIEGGESYGDGGGIKLKSGDLFLINVTIQYNTTDSYGGGLAVNFGTTATLTAVTVSNNSAGYGGGGIAVYGDMSAKNSTISNNGSAGDGNGLLAFGSVTLDFVTVADNVGELNIGTTVDEEVGFLTIYHTILDDGCDGFVESAGYNAINNVDDCVISGDTASNLINFFAPLGSLGNNGGETPTHSLPEGSILIDAGDSSDCPSTDQRGVSRPQGSFCDIGAYEAEMVNDVYVVNSADDTDDGVCNAAHCSLREAIFETYGSFEGEVGEGEDGGGEIQFDIPVSGTPVIAVTSPLPEIYSDTIIDGTTQESGSVRIDGSDAGEEANGLTIEAFNSTIRGLEIVNFDANGIDIFFSDFVLVEQNEIAFNGGDGVHTKFSYAIQISQNNIHDNDGLPIDRDGDGRTANEPVDPSAEEFDDPQNFPVIFTAVPGEGMLVQGLLFSNPEETFTIELFSSATCDQSTTGPQTFIDSFEVTTDEAGNVYFEEGVPSASEGDFLVATATSSDGDTSEFSDCVSASINNTTWPNALSLPVAGDLSPTEIEQFLDQYGQSRWYKFEGQPNSEIIITLTNLPDNYDLAFFQDINAVYQSLLNPTEEDLTLLNAEFAPEAFAPEAFAPEAFAPEAFAPEAFAPEAFAPEAFAPEAFAPEAFAPEAFAPEAFAPEAFAPEAFAPEAFAPEAFAPEAFAPEAFAPEAFAPEAFASAPLRSLLGVSGFPGTSGEGLQLNTWNLTGEFYIRVRGANGAFNTEQPFTLTVAMQSALCDGVSPTAVSHSLSGVAGGYRTLILTDFDRMVGDSAADLQTLQTRLNSFANRSEVQGAIVDLGSDAQVAALHTQADANPACPYAKNLVAESIKELVDAYRAANPNLEYVVIVGNDFVVPFFRYPDNAALANENNYVPPVQDDSASQASLRLGYVLGQDEYGSATELSFKNSSIPIPDMAVGRLVETAVEATSMLDAYLATTNGVVQVNTPSFISGYDFLEDTALAVQDELDAGTGIASETLITPSNISPADPASWTADQLINSWLSTRHDITFLAGHFSQSGALAADYRTRVSTADLLASTVDMQNALIFSAGCHVGYSLVDADGVPFVTESPDWAQAFARKGATLIGGTGYQYGDTEFIEYSERLYLLFSQQLRTGNAPVAIGDALNAAKVDYLASTQTMRGIHQKSVIQATVFGLPMLQYDLSGTRLSDTTDSSVVPSTTAVNTNPGQTFGLSTYDLTVQPQSQQKTLVLKNVEDGTNVTTTYLEGPDGVVANPAEPVLPLKYVNVSVNNNVLRGVGFRGGSYTSLNNIIPLTGAPATEIRGVHGSFDIGFFYPLLLWKANYFDTLGGDGQTRLGITGAQFKSNDIGSLEGTLRRYSNINLRLFYNDNTSSFGGGSTPALDAPPTIVQSEASVEGGEVLFKVTVVGNPAAGIQSVWVTYTGDEAPFAGQWASVDLTQNGDDSTVWEGSLPLNGADPTSVRYLVQAVNGVGLVSLASNLGQGYPVVAFEEPNPAPTTITLTGGSSGAYSDPVTFSAVLRSNGDPVSGERVRISVGGQSKTAVTNQNGRVSVTMMLLGEPASTTARASFAGTPALLPSTDSKPFTIVKKNTAVTLTQPASGFPEDNPLLQMTLTDSSGAPLPEKTVVVVIEGASGSLSRAVITNFAGQATIGNLTELPAGTYNVKVSFAGTIRLHTNETLTINDLLYNPSSDSGTLTILGDEEPPTTTTQIYVTADRNGRFDDFFYNDEDILFYDPNSDTWLLHLDGSDVGLLRFDVDAFVILDNGDILLSFDNAKGNIPGFGRVEDSDIVRFIPTSLGQNSAGSFEMFFDGSDVGLTTGAEDIDALDVLADGRILISTLGNFKVTGVRGSGHDLLLFDPTSLGANTAGSFSLYFDGSKAQLSNGREKVDGVSLDGGDIYLTTRRAFQVTGLTGTGNDIFGCTPSNSDPITACAYSLFWDAETAAFADSKEVINGIHVTSGEIPPPEPAEDVQYISFNSGSTLDGKTFYDEDIAIYDPATGSWSFYFDGQDVGLHADEIDAFFIMENGEILFSVENSRNGFPDIGNVSQSDIIKFTPTSVGENTAGTFSLYFDGSDVGLTSNGEDIGALTLTSDGNIIISTKGNYNLPGGVRGKNGDLILFTPTSLGDNTVGSWSLYLDGRAVGFDNWREDIDAVFIDEATGALILSTKNSFAVDGAAGSGNDLLQCVPNNSGPITDCTFTVFWVGADAGITRPNDVNGVHLK